MPISVITNFSINDSVPFDTRLVATSSISMDNMLYKYAGLTTYRSDLGLNYTYNGSTWSVSSNGIYGGSGNLTSDTTVNFGTVSAALNSDSNKLTFRSYSGGDSNPNSLRVENYFERHGSGYGGVSYKSQFIFSQNTDQGVHNGSYIMYNPKPLFNSGVGGISFGVLAGTFDQEITTSYERMRIDASGIIRFRPNATVVGDSTKSVNIGIDSTDTRPFIGFNWNGSTVDDGTDASYVQFNNSVFSIHHFLGNSSTGTGTHSAIFSRSGVSINGTFSTNRSISFGAADGGVYFVSSNGNGMKYDSAGQGYAALTYRDTATLGSPIRDILTWNNTKIELLKPTYAKESTNMWDRFFNPDYGINAGPGGRDANKYSDLWFTQTTPSENDKNSPNGSDNGASDNNIYVKIDKIKSTTAEFIIFIGTNYDTSTTNPTNADAGVAKNTFSVEAKDYDRIYYFYLDGYNYQIPHQVRWWLGEPSTGTTTNWVQIGNIETGNKEDYNKNSISYTEPGYNNSPSIDYASRFYSQTVLVPAGMLFKIQFRFHVRFFLATASTESNSPRVFINVIRSGQFRKLPTATPTTATSILQLGYPSSQVSGGDPPIGGL